MTPHPLPLWGHLAMTGLFSVTSFRQEVLLKSNGYGPDILLMSYDAENSPQGQKVIWPKMSAALRLRNSALELWNTVAFTF